MQDNFAKALEFVLADEGGNDDDPSDHGGRTSRGITQHEYSAWRSEKNMPPLDVWKAPQAQIEQIYHDEYWMPYGDMLPSGTDYAFFDMDINAGPHRAIILGQRALGVPDDGRVGPVTRAALAKWQNNPMGLLRIFDSYKRAFYRGLNQPKFLRGWLNRCDHVMANASMLIR